MKKVAILMLFGQKKSVETFGLASKLTMQNGEPHHASGPISYSFSVNRAEKWAFRNCIFQKAY